MDDYDATILYGSNDDATEIAAPDVMIGPFVIERELGRGSFGTVMLGIDEDGSKVAIKRIPKGPRYDNIVNYEINILKRLHEYCQTYFVCYLGYMESQHYHYVVTEYLEGYVTLKDILPLPFDSIITATIMTNLVLGLQLMHGLEVVHRDIKPANIMVNPETGDVKYIDFGLSCFLQFCRNVDVGTLKYMSPQNFTHPTEYTTEWYIKDDIWALGITLSELCGPSVIDNYFDEQKMIPDGRDEYRQAIAETLSTHDFSRDEYTKELNGRYNDLLAQYGYDAIDLTALLRPNVYKRKYGLYL